MSAWLGREQAAYSPRPRCALPSPERVGGACRSPACAATRSPLRTTSVAGVRALARVNNALKRAQLQGVPGAHLPA